MPLPAVLSYEYVWPRVLVSVMGLRDDMLSRPHGALPCCVRAVIRPTLSCSTDRTWGSQRYCLRVMIENSDRLKFTLTSAKIFAIVPSSNSPVYAEKPAKLNDFSSPAVAHKSRLRL